MSDRQQQQLQQIIDKMAAKLQEQDQRIWELYSQLRLANERIELLENDVEDAQGMAGHANARLQRHFGRTD